MKPFTGPKRQGGWIGMVAAAAVSAYETDKENEQRKEDREDANLDSAESFARRAWLDQQQRKFELQDRQYKEDAIAGYRPFYTGPEVATPKPTTTQGLADWDPNAEGANPALMASTQANPYGYPYGD
jgi:hypothetical protein